MSSTTIGQLVSEAMARKGQAEGRRYTFRELEADSGVNFSHAAKVVRGKRHPSRDMIEALARALAPYLSLEEAMVAAGYVPGGDRASLLRRFARLPFRAQLEALDHAMHATLTEPVPDDDAERERERQADAEEQPDHPRAPAPCTG